MGSRELARWERVPLTRRRIAEAALALVDREGAEALTMRRLGQELRVAAMSLYNHVSGREELLDAVTEVMVGQIGIRFGDSPREALSRFVHGIRQIALSHPEAFELVGMRPLQTPESLAPVEVTLGALRAMGFADHEAVHALRTLVAYARGFALGEIAGFTLEATNRRSRIDPRDLAPESFPHIVELAPQLAEPNHDAAFAFGLESLLAGLDASARRRAGSDRRGAAPLR